MENNNGHLEFIDIYGACRNKIKEFKEQTNPSVMDSLNLIAETKAIELKGIINYNKQIADFIGYKTKAGELLYIVVALNLLSRNYQTFVEKIGQKEKFNELLADCAKHIKTLTAILPSQEGGGEK